VDGFELVKQRTGTRHFDGVVAEFARDKTLDVTDVLKMDQTVDADE